MSRDDIFTDLAHLSCPYCGAPIQLVIDPAGEDQEYIEDCEVCCQPMLVRASADGPVELFREDD